jgi:biotin carboxyl carrier protein
MKPDFTEPSLFSEFESLACFNGEPGIFWGRLCEYARGRLQTDSVCLLVGGAGSGAEIRVLAQSPPGAARRLAQAGLTSELPNVRSPLFAPLPGLFGQRYQALALPAREGLPSLWMVAENAAGVDQNPLTESVSQESRSLTDMYQARRHARRSEEKLLTLSEVLDLGLALGESTNFQEAALRLCNELAAPMRATRVSLAWVEGHDLKLKATSHGGRISASSGEALALQQVMEEATDQDNEVSYPELRGTSVVSREHRQFSVAHEGVAVLSVPLRHAQEAVGAICLERRSDDGAWESGELERVRLLADLVAPRLEGLHAQTGWWGRRMWRVLRRRAAGLLGPEHTGWKLGGILTVLTVLALSLIKVEHKVRAPFILKTDAAAVISAPFPGFIQEAHYHVGDIVKKGQKLANLDQKELLLEEADTVAARDKGDREARGHEIEGHLGPMRVSQAEVQQAEAKLAIIHHRLELTQITAPFDGVVVEGDLRERLSSPVQTGEPLLKIVQLTDLFGQLQVDDRDIAYLAAGREGELAFASRPGEKHSVRIDRLEPVAEIRPEGTVFLLRVQVLGDPQAWWRPGMSGICKIDAGKRSLLWIAGHRLVETLRLWFWI